MKQRNIFAVLFLSIITIGIYDLYWLYKTKKVLNERTKVHVPTIWLLFAPFLLIIALMIIAFSVGLANSHTANSTLGSQTVSSSGSALGATAIILVLELVAIVIIIPVTFYWYFKYSKAINEYTNGDLNTGVTFLLLWLLHFIGVMIVQDKFNDMIAAGQGEAAQPVAESDPGLGSQVNSSSEPVPLQAPDADASPVPATPEVTPESVSAPELPSEEAPTAANSEVSENTDSAPEPDATVDADDQTPVVDPSPEQDSDHEEEPLLLPEHGEPDPPTVPAPESSSEQGEEPPESDDQQQNG